MISGHPSELLGQALSDNTLDQNKNAPEVLSDEESGNVIDRDYTGVFEGPEKALEVVFRSKEMPIGEESGEKQTGDPKKLGLRQLGRSDLDRICQRARCDIVSSISNSYLDAYVLS